MSQYENLGGASPRTADGVVTVMGGTNQQLTAVACVPMSVQAKALSRCMAALYEFGEFFEFGAGNRCYFSVTCDANSKVIFVSFTLEEKSFNLVLIRFLEYLRQSRVMVNPIVVDLTQARLR